MQGYLEEAQRVAPLSDARWIDRTTTRRASGDEGTLVKNPDKPTSVWTTSARWQNFT